MGHSVGETATCKSDQKRWEAVRTRDGDGSFWYAVLTTGVCCRPSCSSRLPNRENVEFFDTYQEALAAGYRPCKRCNPGTSTKDEVLEQKVVRACRSMEQSEIPLTLKDLAREACLSPYYFHRIFKKIVGVTPKQYSVNLRSLSFKEGLKAGVSVTDAIYGAGYSSSSGAYNKKQDHLAMTPTVYGAAGITIRYAIAECFLGWLLVGATDRGICAIAFGDDPQTLPQELQDRFSKALLQEAGTGFRTLVQEVVEFVNKPGGNFKIPLDIQGTVFQRKVWTVLQQIKAGETLTYTEVAEKLGNPAAVRAVATACASNTLAVVIPCHRVIAKNGNISGYRWGRERKKMLLERERDIGGQEGERKPGSDP